MDRGKCDYISHYCEENIYKLISKLGCDKAILENLYVIFLSSKSKRTYIWHQRMSECDFTPCIWDYHVVLLLKKPCAAEIFDLDSTLDFPVDAVKYLDESCRTHSSMRKDDYPIFRIIRAENYLDHFASDRSHMKHGSSWLAPPPDWPPIVGRLVDCTHNLESYVNVTATNDPVRGCLLDSDGFRLWLIDETTA